MSMDHLQQRRRLSEALEPFPASTFWKRLLDRLVFVAGVVGPLTTLPQLLKIYLLHQSRGVSPMSWGFPALLDIPWIVYGVVHRNRPITITYTLWLVMNGAICIGAIIYGSGPY